MTDQTLQTLAQAGRIAMAGVIGLGLVVATQAKAESTPRELAGKRVAEANCADCHAVAQGDSPLADAPPFRTLSRRYRPGVRLEQLLSEGMIAAPAPPEEGARALHPRMPQIRLDDEQRADLTAYIRSLQPQADQP